MHSVVQKYCQFDDIYRGKRVLVTGHTGFKGSWLSFWLSAMGANLLGYSLAPDSTPNHFSLIESDLAMKSVFGDIRDLDRIKRIIDEFQPEIVFHLAAQPFVQRSYDDPIETLHTNVIGTANLLECCRSGTSVRAIVNITSDKCYENREWVWGYRENDPMGGYDPYSASKGCAELVTSAYRNSFFNPSQYTKTHNVLLASARAGNVIGGGDWGCGRLIPDIVKAIADRRKVRIRNPNAIRPWQHVLEPLSGYLLLGQRLMEGWRKCAEGWNFGPKDEGSISVDEVLQHFKAQWDVMQYELESEPQPHEATRLKLDCSKASTALGWEPVWETVQNFEKTVFWYKAYYEQGSVKTLDDLEAYIQEAFDKKLCWARR